MNKNWLYKIIGFVILILVCKWAYATTYIGKDNKNTSFYICNDNKEVAELLGYNENAFDLSDCKIVVEKTEKRTENVGVYIVMITRVDTFVVCYRAADYDIFFYSWDYE